MISRRVPSIRAIGSLPGIRLVNWLATITMTITMTISITIVITMIITIIMIMDGLEAIDHSIYLPTYTLMIRAATTTTHGAMV